MSAVFQAERVKVNRARLEPDPWLASHVGKPVFHLLGQIDAEACRNMARQLAGHDLFADAKIAVDQTPQTHAVQELGFNLVQTAVRFQAGRSAIPVINEEGIEFAKPEMVDPVGAIAERSFVHDRFHSDALIPRPIADAIKREWARNYFSGERGDWMVVARRKGEPIGFLQLLRSTVQDLVIDLIAVDQDHRGEGIARAMISFAARHCEVPGAIVVDTQITNVASVRLYEALGFRLGSAQYVFHYHGTAR